MTHHIRPKAVFNWSGGKDSALALHQVLQEDRYEIVALLTTVNRSTRRSSMHGIPTELLQRQADSIGIPLYVVDLTPKGNMEDYETAMRGAVKHFKAIGAGRFIFGDIFLHDVRTYREKQLAPYGIEVIEPLWGRTSGQIMEEFLASGLETVIVTTTADVLGREFNRAPDRRETGRRPARRSRSLRGKRRIPYVLLRRGNVPHESAFHARDSDAAKLSGQARRRYGTFLYLLVRRPERVNPGTCKASDISGEQTGKTRERPGNARRQPENNREKHGSNPERPGKTGNTDPDKYWKSTKEGACGTP